MHDRPGHLIWLPGHELLLRDIVRAENCYLYDSRGTRYVDLESGVWCTSIGHAHPRILRVIGEQAAKISHTGFNYSNDVVEGSAREILSLLGFHDGRCVFLCSGSEAIEYGVRTARMIVRQPLFMTMSDSYFGAYGSANRRDKSEWYDFDWTACSACPHGGECDERCEHWSAVPWDTIGAFLFEPGSSSGLVRFPPEELVRNIAAMIRKNEGLLLVNEVTTGVGRTGLWFGFQHYGVSPDVVAIGKGIGNGYPVSITAFAPGVIDRLGGRQLKFASSHQNDPLGAAVAREVVSVIEEESLIERGRATGAALVQGLERIQERTSRIQEIRSRGLMAAVQLRDDADASFTIRAHRELVRCGYVVGRRPAINVLRLDPSLTIDRKDIEGFLETFEDLLGPDARSVT